MPYFDKCWAFSVGYISLELIPVCFIIDNMIFGIISSFVQNSGMPVYDYHD